MKTTTIKSVFQFRRATTEEWESVNPILRVGEPAYDITLKKHKIGDGVTVWNDLPYQEGIGTADKIDWANILNAPTKLSQFDNDLDIPDSSYIDEKLAQKADVNHNHDGVYQPVGDYLTEEIDPTVPDWAKQAEKPTYDYTEIENTPDLTEYVKTEDLNSYAKTEYVDSKIEETTYAIKDSVKNPLNITGAEVGQVAKVKSVDENGAPTEWETADISGGIGKDPLFISAQKFHNRPGTTLAYAVDAKDFSRVASVGEKANIVITNAADAEGVWAYFCEATVEDISSIDEDGNPIIYAVMLSSICDLTPSDSGSLAVTSVNGKTGAVVLEASDIINTSTDSNKVSVASDGTLEVNFITADKIIQNENSEIVFESDELIIFGGNADG